MDCDLGFGSGVGVRMVLFGGNGVWRDANGMHQTSVMVMGVDGCIIGGGGKRLGDFRQR